MTTEVKNITTNINIRIIIGTIAPVTMVTLVMGTPVLQITITMDMGTLALHAIATANVLFTQNVSMIDLIGERWMHPMKMIVAKSINIRNTLTIANAVLGTLVTVIPALQIATNMDTVLIHVIVTMNAPVTPNVFMTDITKAKWNF